MGLKAWGLTPRRLAIAVAVAGVAYGLYTAWPRRMNWVLSTLTGKKYKVKNQPGSQEVADRLAFMELRIRDFLYKANKYAPGDPVLANISKRWSGSLAETLKDEDVAYSVGKDTISVCVRAPNGSLESENTCMFVLIHELAHVATDSYGHHPEFWINMKFLLELAEATGVYRYQDFDKKQVSYCGRQLAGSPLSCIKNGQCESELQKRRRGK